MSELAKNPHVAGCTSKTITYRAEFKVEALRQYQQEGLSPNQIFARAGFDLAVLHKKLPSDRIRDWLKIMKARGVAGLVDRAPRSGRPRRFLEPMSDQDKVRYLQAQVEYLKAENAFLAKLRAELKR